MAIKPSNFVLARDSELPLGTVYTREEKWFLRVQIMDRDITQEAAFELTSERSLDWMNEPATVLSLAPQVSLEVRVIGPIRGPGVPPTGSLVWTAAGDQAIYFRPTFVRLNGKETKDVNKDRAFFAEHWGGWLIGEDGKELSADPLFVVGKPAV
ncbi:hypothetical protein VDG03_18285 [Xanthomonas campestris pv. raphani]|uniref:hypothetical protein n=1 Tax=Xanthomonas campestris TaxID=339 RepID=UPI001F3CBDCB|nr:hypothetical protein [Xanthomonas campestris]MCF8828558.1 hypothetical protein [Xanthomonas campestris pv. raphani]MEA9752926.1 hypothetical protein [Xanthomonas campestris pv. raphani]MEA9813192.1 hypothetical protein [Xanthomonas campestris pv. raphani]MEA9935285.1 hypothetical protein [Xanthomonas campestris pv. raphani]WDJ08194.1 hypothetical protein JH261_20750 [Xanthomonas campestris pv. incanae]